MPQTLLAVLAITIAGALMLGQNQTMNESVQHVVEDEFDVLIPGVILRTLEFADSRAFDDATTPEKLRDNLGLGGVISAAAIDTLSADDLRGVQASDFAPLSQLGLDATTGAVAGCNLENLIKSVRCNDISDMHTLPDSAGNPWRLVTLRTSGGDPLEVEVRIEVNYVDIHAPDTPVKTPTFHKRVDVFARSPLLVKSNPNQFVRTHRVISYDPVVASEYLRRKLVADMNKTLDKAATELAAAREAERIAGETLNEARTAAERAKVALDAATNTLNDRKSDLSSLRADVEAAVKSLEDAQSGSGASEKDLRDLEKSLDKARDKVSKEWDQLVKTYRKHGGYSKKTEKALREYQAAVRDAESAQAALDSARRGGSAPDAAAIASAQATLTAARAALAAAEAQADAAQAAVNKAQSAYTAASATLAAARAAYDVADAALLDALEAYEAAKRRADYSNRS